MRRNHTLTRLSLGTNVLMMCINAHAQLMSELIDGEKSVYLRCAAATMHEVNVHQNLTRKCYVAAKKCKILSM